MGCEICACCLWPPHFLAHDALPFPTPRRAVELVLSLEEHVQRLFLLVLSGDQMGGQQPQQQDGAGQQQQQAGGGPLGEVDIINGLAVLAVLTNSAYGEWPAGRVGG